MYKEILKLKNWCEERGVEFNGESLFENQIDCLRFNNGDDVIQHRGSYGCDFGCVEFATILSNRMSYKATSLKNAKRWILKHKDELNQHK